MTKARIEVDAPPRPIPLFYKGNKKPAESLERSASKRFIYNSLERMDSFSPFVTAEVPIAGFRPEDDNS
jgi:hypothetical protein